MSTAASGNYTVLARRYRPQAFGDVVGQEHVAQALKNAIRGNRVAHAYLFTGARGVGKTSTARILAKALNCPAAVDGNPCNECEMCAGISTGNDVDVLEIDGASNRGIDDIRQLRANVNIRSMRSRYKIYIIDEVHMLTKEAFNALLKTLEEPPPNVKFVFCTTEPGKVPDTILSRCQRFDFGTIETSNIGLRLRQIAAAEGVQVADDAIELVARRAAGSMRDSQSIFDQLLAFGEEHIAASDVHRLLGTASDARLTGLADALVRRQPAAVLERFHAALDDGVQLGELTDQLLYYLRDLMVLASGAAALELLSVAPGSRAALQAQATEWGLATIVAALQILSDTRTRMQRVTCSRALVELALVRIATQEHLAPLSDLIASLKRGEPAAGLPASAVPLPSTGGEKKNDRAGVAPPPTVSAARVEPAIGEARSAASPAPEAAASPRPLPSPVESPAPAPGPGVRFDSGTRDEPSEMAEEIPADAFAAIREASAEPAARSHGDPSAVAARVAWEPSNAALIWSQVLDQLKDMVRDHARMVSRTAILMPNKLELGFPKRYSQGRRFCERPEVLSRLEETASALTGVNVRITLTQVDDENEITAVRPAEQAGAKALGRRRSPRPEDDDFVMDILARFEAKCVDVTPIVAAPVRHDADPAGPEDQRQED